MDPLAVLAYGAEQALPLTGTGTGVTQQESCLTGVVSVVRMLEQFSFQAASKMSSDSEDCTAIGKLFNTRAAVELNARPPMVTCLVRTLSMADDDDV